MAWWQMVSRPGKQQRPLLGNGAGDQEARLLEICGPLFMPNPVITNLQHRLKESGGVTLITFRHQSLGLILEEYRNAKNGGNYIHEKVRQRAEGPRPH
jgi:hypothetical protein